MRLVDTHCHIYGESYKEDLEEVIERTGKNLEFIVNIGYDLASSEIAVNLSNKYPFVYATVGVHPTDISGYSDGVEERLLELSEDKKVVAIGEIGLDYYWMKDPKDVQAIYFRKQMDIAKKLKLPVVIHTRDAMEDTVNILNEYRDIKGIMHCYPGSYETAKTLMDRYYFGVAGVVTFKNNVKTKEFVEKMPLDRLIIETDSPYLTPMPHRGKRNEPNYVEFVAQEIAKIKGISYEEVVRVTTENAKKIYGIK